MSSGATTGSIHGASSAIGPVCAARATSDSQVPVTSTPRARHAQGGVVKSPSVLCYVTPSLCPALLPPATLSAPVAAWYSGIGGRGNARMTFEVGETVVYPHHGAALIEAIESRTSKGEERMYLVLKVAQGDLTVRVPADNAEYVGVRDVVGQDGLERVFEILKAPHTEEPTNWSRRYKANVEKIASGDVNKVAEVVRDLWRRDRERGLSAGEKRMLAKARQILVSELALAEGTNEDKAELLLDEVLAS